MVLFTLFTFFFMAKRKCKSGRAAHNIGPLTPEQQLEVDQTRWSASVYSHFHPAQIAKDGVGNYELYKGEPIYIFVCKKYDSPSLLVANAHIELKL